MDAATWQPGDDHQRQARRAHRHGGEQRVPKTEDYPGELANGYHVMLDTGGLVTVPGILVRLAIPQDNSGVTQSEFS